MRSEIVYRMCRQQMICLRVALFCSLYYEIICDKNSQRPDESYSSGRWPL